MTPAALIDTHGGDLRAALYQAGYDPGTVDSLLDNVALGNGWALDWVETVLARQAARHRPARRRQMFQAR